MGGKIAVRGIVVTGLRQAAFFTQLDWVQKQCREKLGFEPYPGTLNLEVLEEYLPLIQELQNEEGIKLIPPDSNFCEGKTLKISVEKIKGALIVPSEEVKVHKNNIIELMAPIFIRSALQLNDGDILTVGIET